MFKELVVTFYVLHQQDEDKRIKMTYHKIFTIIYCKQQTLLYKTARIKSNNKQRNKIRKIIAKEN